MTVVMSQGSSITVCTTISGSYTAVAGVQKIKWKGKRGTSKTSTLADTMIRKKPKGQGDVGEITVDALFDATQFGTLFGYHEAGTQVYWKIVDAAGSITGPFFGHISDFDQDIPEDDPLQWSMTIDCSSEGSQTFTP